MAKKYGLTKHEQTLLDKARNYQQKANEYHRKFANSLQDRFYNSEIINEFEDWDLWTLCESGDSSGTEQEAYFWSKVKEEEQD